MTIARVGSNLMGAAHSYLERARCVCDWFPDLLERSVDRCSRNPVNSQFSMHFYNAAIERAYAEAHAAQLRSRLCLLLIAFAIYMSLLLCLDTLFSEPYSANSAGATLQAHRSAVFLAVTSMCIGTVLLTRCRQLWAYGGPFGLEMVTVLTMSFCGIGLVFMHVGYLAKVLDIDPHDAFPEGIDLDDAALLLGLDALVTVSHIVLPVRWSVLVFSEVNIIACYCVPVFWLGSWHRPIRARLQLVALVLLVALSAMGKRAIERKSRTMFHTTITERAHRANLEHQLELLKVSGAPEDEAGSVVRSAAASDATGELFSRVDGMSGALANQLTNVMELGLREHWLISSTELAFPRSGMPLGAGSFGVVIPASFHGLKVAVKASRLETASINNLCVIANELRVLRRVRHPNIVLFYGAHIDPNSGEIALVLEYIPGLQLTKHLASQTPPVCPDSRLDLLLDICCALRYLHGQHPPVVHGDLKGSNVCVEEVGSNKTLRVKLLDFGLSRLITRTSPPLGGTVAWMAPELLGKHKCPPESSADVFSFGRLIYLVMTGQKPLATIEKAAIIRHALRGRPHVLTWPVQCPFREKSRRLCDELWHIDPRQRPCIATVHAQLIKWRPAGAEGIVAGDGDFHSALHEVRSVLMQQSGASLRYQAAHNQTGPVGLPTDSVGIAETVIGAPARHVSGAAAAPPLAEIAQNDGCSMQLPEFVQTPDDTKNFTMMDALLTWNCAQPVNNQACCVFHSIAKLELTLLLARFANFDCMPSFKPHSGWQCPTCMLVDYLEGDMDSVVCTLCGYSETTTRHMRRHGPKALRVCEESNENEESDEDAGQNTCDGGARGADMRTDSESYSL
eukprot:NODE_664_length_2853_cov_13.797506.p1 GENE.NODE_664_length_2853_cov_13.797506~~NODE_664_length_2853_cov_13.797506.p1  ORF type:complete len:850 (-),score=127.35 NODE_664_length_2853_cov_13.797506:228-2777(-)